MGPPLPAYSPESSCPKCSTEDPSLVYHEGGTIGAPCWPAVIEDRVFGPHICKRCSRCGHGWVEATADAGAYAEKESREDAMPIRKEASSGQVLGTEGEGIQKTAATEPLWQAEDEDALAMENANADED